MELFKAFVTILARDEASSEVEEISNNIMGKLAGAAKTAAKALGALWAGNQIVQFGKDAFYAYSQFEQLEGGVAKLYGNAGQSVEEYAASVGQSVDEAQAAFERNERAQEMVMANAQQAWKTAGMDANAYMQTATSFSASLINSLGGDTEEAARLTDEAMKAMSDNINTFGTDAQNVQNAFQGFAKQNYMMLDNLKLGYGGTKTEMERLIKDASQMTKEQEDLNMTVDAGSMSFDNIVKAIQVVQKHQGIYGTTTREALHTIEGSMNATKAAWSNLVAELGKPDADLNARVADLATALFGEFDEQLGRKSGGLIENVKNEVVTVASNMGTALVNGLQAAFDLAVANVPTLALNMVKGISDAIRNAATGLRDINIGGGLREAMASVFDDGGALSGIGGMFSGIAEAVSGMAPEIAEGFSALMYEAGRAITDNGPILISYMAETIGGMATSVVEHMPEIINGFIDGFFGLINTIGGLAADIGTAFVTAWPTIKESFRGAFAGLPDILAETVPNLLSKVGELLGKVGSAILEHGPELVGKLAELFMSAVESITSRGPELVSKVAELLGNVISSIIQFLVQHGPEILNAAGEMIMNIATAIADHAPEILGNIAETIGSLVGYVAGAAASMLQAGIEFIGGLLDGSNEGFDDVMSWFEGVPDMLVEALGDLSSLLSDIGLSVINGFWDGMKSAWSSVTSWVSGIADWIKAHKGPEEYDKRLLIPNGQWIMGSLNKGLMVGFEKVKKTLAAETYEISKQFRDGLDMSVSNYQDFGFPTMQAQGNMGQTVVNKYYSINGITVAPDSAIANHMETLYDEVEQYERMGIDG